MALSKLFSEHTVLENQHIMLVPFSPEHEEGLSLIAFDPEIWRWTSPHINTRNDFNEYVRQLIANREEQEKYPFTIIEKSTQRVAGITTYMSISPEHRRLEIGSTWLGRAFHGTGVNKSCKFLLLRYAFEQLNCIRVELKTDFNNAQSRKAITKLGAKEEGVLRQHMIMPGGRVRDTVYYSLLKEEWPAIKKNIFGEFSKDHFSNTK